MFEEICVLEGIQTKTVAPATQAFDFLASADANYHENGRKVYRWVVLLDNLQVSYEGQTVLAAQRDLPSLRAALKIVCVAVDINCQCARGEYGEVLDAYLVMPLRVAGVLAVIGVESNG